MQPAPSLGDLLARYDGPAPRYTSYPPVPAWTPAFGPAEFGAALEAAGRAPEPLALYVHLPFCRRLCAYCGCNVVVARDPAAADAYLPRLAEEMRLVTERLGDRPALREIHWGGGTPTFLQPAQIAALYRAIVRAFAPAPDAAWSIEVDPRVTTWDQLCLLASLGFDRLSIGVQDLDGAVQGAIGRGQTPAQTRATIESARALRFRAINLDLVYGLPRQTEQTWRRTLDEVVALRPDRLALFSFAYVPALRPNQRRLPVADLPGPAARWRLFTMAEEALAAAGYRAVGLDHFALPDDELCRSAAEGSLRRSFQGYSTGPARVLGLGASAISDLGDAYAQNAARLGDYHAAIDAGRLATVRGLALQEGDVARRAIIGALMSRLSVDLGARAGSYEPELSALRPLEADGLVRLDGTRVEVTAAGRPFLRRVAMVFDAHARGQAPGARVI